MKIHPGDLLLEGLLSGPDSEAAVSRHVARCGRCRQRLAELRPGSLMPPRTSRLVDKSRKFDYDEVFVRAKSRWERLGATYELERQESSRLFSDLMAHPPTRQKWMLSQHPRFQTWGLLERILAETQRVAAVAPLRSEQLAQLALALCDALDREHYGTDQLADLRARSWAMLGNARRIRADLDPAEEAFEIAFWHLRRGTGEPLEKAVLLDLKASLLRARRRFDDSVRALQRAISLFREIGDLHQIGRSLVNLSTVYEHAGRSDRAIAALEQASLWIDEEREPRLVLYLHHNLITCLTSVGRVMEAQSILAKKRLLYERFSEPPADGRRRWVEARIASRLGAERQAEDLLRSAHAVFTRQDAPFDTALVTLELGALYAHQGRSEDLKGIGEELLTFFASRHIDREMRATMELFG